MRSAWMLGFSLALAGCLASGTASTGGNGGNGAGGSSGNATSATSGDSGSSGSTSTTSGTTSSGATTTTGTSTTSSTTTTGTSGPTDFHRDSPLDGSTVDLLHFAVIGDCRPASYVNDASQVPSVYPTAIITDIFNKIVAQNPQFALFSGDVLYTLNPPDKTSGAAQIDQFLSARNQMDRPLAPALGNHEDTDSINLSTWSSKFAIGGNNLAYYYSFIVHTSLGDAEFIVADDTYWDTRQMAWISSQLQSSARFHIVLKHQPTDSSDNTETDFNNLVAQYHPDLILTGHSHTYDHPHSRELVLGTAGAPLSQTAPGHGFAIVDQTAGGKFTVTTYITGSNSPVDSWTTP